MYVDEPDQDAFRFLWFPEGDLSQQPVSYRMNVHILDCTSSSFVAAFAWRKTALDDEVDVSTEAVSIVKHDFYIDDMCTSVSNVDNAKELMEQVSNFRVLEQVLESVPPEDRASSVVDLSNH